MGDIVVGKTKKTKYNKTMKVKKTKSTKAKKGIDSVASGYVQINRTPDGKTEVS